MSDPVWSVPVHRLDAATVRRRILLQHARIRLLLAHARQLAEQALDQQPLPADAVASAIGDIHATLDVHLRFEEKVLIEILNDDLPLGPERATRLQQEHAKQRATLTNLHGEAKASPHLPILAAKLAFLTSWLLADMEDEEENLLTSAIVRDDLVNVDQSSG